MFIKEQPCSDDFEKMISIFKGQIRDKSLRYINHKFKIQIPEGDEFIKLTGISWALAITLLYKTHLEINWDSLDLHNYAKSVNRALFNGISDSIQTGRHTAKDWLYENAAHKAFDFLGNPAPNYNLVKKSLLINLIKTLPSFSYLLEDEIDYPFWLSHATWNYITTACLLIEQNPKNLRYDISLGQRNYHVPIEKKHQFTRYIEIFESWGIESLPTTEWIERCIHEQLDIPQKLWDEFKAKHSEKCKYDEYSRIMFPAIQNKINVPISFDQTINTTLKNNQMKNSSSPANLPDNGNTTENTPSSVITDSDEEAELTFLRNPKDRNPRLYKRAVEIFLKNPNSTIASIHAQIIEEEKDKSNVSESSLKHIVKLRDIKKSAKEKVARQQ
jgi:hypothetical protein